MLYIVGFLHTDLYFQHEGLAQLPFSQFYNSGFECGNSEQQSQPQLKIWPGDGRTPSVFCYVSGKEETVTMEDLSISYSNQAEINVAVGRMSLSLIKGLQC